MKKILSAILIIPLLMLSTAVGFGAAKRVPDGATIAVLPFHNKSGEVEGLNFGDASAISNTFPSWASSIRAASFIFCRGL